MVGSRSSAWTGRDGGPQSRVGVWGSTFSVRWITLGDGLGSGFLVSSSSSFTGVRAKWRQQCLAGLWETCREGKAATCLAPAALGMIVSLPFPLQVSPPCDPSALYSFGTF